jgi:hypothetical protein
MFVVFYFQVAFAGGREKFGEIKANHISCSISPIQSAREEKKAVTPMAGITHIFNGIVITIRIQGS